MVHRDEMSSEQRLRLMTMLLSEGTESEAPAFAACLELAHPVNLKEVPPDLLLVLQAFQEGRLRFITGESRLVIQELLRLLVALRSSQGADMIVLLLANGGEEANGHGWTAGSDLALLACGLMRLSLYPDRLSSFKTTFEEMDCHQSVQDQSACLHLAEGARESYSPDLFPWLLAQLAEVRRKRGLKKDEGRRIAQALLLSALRLAGQPQLAALETGASRDLLQERLHPGIDLARGRRRIGTSSFRCTTARVRLGGAARGEKTRTNF